MEEVLEDESKAPGNRASDRHNHILLGRCVCIYVCDLICGGVRVCVCVCVCVYVLFQDNSKAPCNRAFDLHNHILLGWCVCVCVCVSVCV